MTRDDPVVVFHCDNCEDSITIDVPFYFETVRMYKQKDSQITRHTGKVELIDFEGGANTLDWKIDGDLHYCPHCANGGE